MAGKHKDLSSSDDLRGSIAHLDQVSARISRLSADLASRDATPAPDNSDQPCANHERAEHGQTDQEDTVVTP
jgi:hypothetical protein